MRETVALLISTDPSLAVVVREAAEGVSCLRADVVAGDRRGVLARLESGDVSVVLFHQTEDEGSSSAPTYPVGAGVTSRRRSVATLIVSDRHRGSDALGTAPAGGGRLSEPTWLDLNRLAYLLDVTSLRARLAGRPAGATAAPEPGGRCALGTVEEPFLYAATDRMDVMMAQVRRVAASDATLLLGGETGTGKTRLARLVHDPPNTRAAEPFLVVNCGALSANLIESEMFGHVRGSFTGADRDHSGKFTEVGRGTLFLDEIDSLPPASQAKLLRAAEERLFEPVGSNRPERLRARLIAASNRALDREVEGGRFRADLYYRLNVVSFTLPPLRERRGIIPVLAGAFAAGFAGSAGRPAPELGPGVVEALCSATWPGNVRERARLPIERRAVALSAGPRIEVEDLTEALLAAPRPPAPPAAVRLADLPARQAGSTLAHSKETAELERITEALVRHGNNRLRTAAELGINRMTPPTRSCTSTALIDASLTGPPAKPWDGGPNRFGVPCLRTRKHVRSPPGRRRRPGTCLRSSKHGTRRRPRDVGNAGLPQGERAVTRVVPGSVIPARRGDPCLIRGHTPAPRIPERRQVSSSPADV